jgi:transposase-like protein
MKTYPAEFKDKIIAQRLPPPNRRLPELTRETGLPKDTRYSWRGQHRPAPEALLAKAAGGEGLTSQDQFQWVVESAPLNEHEVGACGRRRGVFPAHLAAWQEACSGATEGRPRREDSTERRDLARRHAEVEGAWRRQEKALAAAAARLLLPKKVRALWAAPEAGRAPLGRGQR